MNKIYKLIWSQTANAFVAVSELATARDKSSSTTNNAALGAWVAVSEITKSKGKKSNKAIKSGVLVSSLVLFAGNAIAAPYDAGGGSATGSDSVAIGSGAASQGLGSVAMGANSEAIGINSTAIGPGAKTAADDALAIGRMAQAIGKYSTAVGDQAKANKEFSNAFGYRATANAVRSTAIGMNSSTSGDDSVSIGNSSSVSGNWSAALGQEASVQSDWSTAIGFKANAKGTGSTAIGTWAKTSGVDAAAFGNAAEASGSESLALGRSAKTDSMADQALAVGFNASAAGITSNAIGANAKTTARNATAIGSGAKAYSHSGIAMGTNAEAGSVGSEDTLVQAMALGANSKAKAQSKDVALGEGSETSTVANTKNTQIDGKTYTYAGTNAKSTLSVGKSGAERTITNVAAGRVSATSTDAINGSQLYGTNQAINSLADDVDTLGNTTAAAIGGNSTYNPSNHTVSAPTYNINNQNVSTVSGAINKLNEGWNLTSNGNSTAAVRTNDTVDIGTATGETNLIVAKNGNTIDYSLNKKLDLGATGSVNAGGTVINNNGLSFVDSNGATLANTPSIKKDGINAGGQQIANVKAGTGDTDAVNVSQLKAATTHYYSVNDGGTQGSNYNNDGATGGNSLAAGVGTQASGISSTAIGHNAKASSANAIAMGVNASASQRNALAMGSSASSATEDSVAIGKDVKVLDTGAPQTDQEGSVAIGSRTEVSGKGSVGIGRNVRATARNAVAIGDAALATNTQAVAIARDAQASGAGAVAMGSASRSTSSHTTALGVMANASVSRSVALGSEAVADRIGFNIAMSPVTTDANATFAANQVYANAGATQAAKNAVIATVRNTTTDTYGAVSVGNAGVTRQIINLAPGSEDSDAVNVAQLKAATTHYYSVNDNGVQRANYNNDGATGINSLAAGTAASATESAATAVGNQATAAARNSVALGNQATANTAWSVAIGNKADATGSSAVAIGNGATTTVGDSVALGAGSKADANGRAVTEATVNGLTFGDFAGSVTHPGKVVSVGAKGEERQIKNVAPGQISNTSTDAINGSQLYATNAKLGNVAKTVVENFGGNATLNPDGSITYTNIGNTGKDNIHDAIQAATTKVAGDQGVTVSPSTNPDGSTTYTVAAKTDGVTTQVDSNGNIAAVTAPLTTNTDGKVNTPAAPNALATAGDIANAINNSGWKLAADGTTGTELINPSDTVTFKTGSSNLTVKRDGANITYDLAKDIAVDSVKTGDTTVNTYGVSIANADPNKVVSLTASGLNNGNNRITNVAAGTADTDAVNVSQLKAAQAATTTKVEGDKGVSVTPKTNADGSKTYTVAAKTDNTTVKVDDKGNIAAVTAPLTYTDGKVNTPAAPNALATAGDIANAINNSGWKATSGATGSGVVNGTTEELINPSETVTFQAGDNMVLNQAGNVFTYSLNKDININSVKFGDNGPTIKADANNNINIAKSDGSATKITNVANGDVNANSTDAVNGSQLYAAQAAATTKVEGDKGVSVTPTTNADGSKTYTVAAKTDNTTVKVDDNGNIAAVTAPLTTNTDGKVNTPAAPNALATAGDIANAINNSGWKATSGATGSGVVNGTTEELINPSETVTFQAGDNMVLNQAGNVFTYSLNKDININSVKFGDNGPTIKADANNNINIAKSDGSATKITNVADGDVNANSTDAVNGSQLYAAQAAATTKVEGDKGVSVTPTTNADGSKTYTVAAKTDNTTVKVDDNGNIAAVTAPLTTNTDGKVNTPAAPNALATAGDIANAINNSGWKATSGATGSGVVNGTTEELINPSETVTFQAGDNMVLNQAGNVFTYSLNKDININSVKFGDNGPTIKADANNNINIAKSDGSATKITNVADGDVNANSTDAVNGSQLYAAQAAATTKVEGDKGVSVTPTTNADGSKTYTVAAKTDNTTVKVDDNGNIAAVTTTFTPSTDGKVGAPVGNGDSLVTANTVANAINNSGWKLAADGTTGTELINPSDTVTFKTGSSNLTVKRDGANITYDLAKDININSVKFGDNGPTIKADASNNINIAKSDGSATKITNVEAGTGDKDAVNVSQLKAAQAAATTKVEGDKGVSVTPTTNADGSKTYTVAAKTDNTTVKVDDNGNIAAVTTTFTPSTDGKVGAPVGNGDSLVTANTVANAINNSGWKLAADGTTGTELINPSDTVTFKTGSSNLTVKRDGANITYDLAKDININSVKFGDNGPTIKADASNNINIAKSDGSATKITNVEAGTGDKDAVNVSQLKAAQAAATTKVEAGDNMEVTSSTNADGSKTYTVATKKDVNFDSVTVGPVVINKDGINAGDKKITNVAPGEISATSKDAVNGSQLYQAVNNINADIAASKEEVKSADGSVTVTTTQNAKGANVYDLSVNTDGTTIKKNADGSLAVNTTPLTNTDGKVNTPAAPNALATAGDIANAINNSGFTLTAQGSNGSLVKPGATVDMNNTDGNIVISKSASDNNVTYDLAKDLKVGSVTAGDTVVNNDGITINNGSANGNTVSLTKDGLNNGGNRITNVAPGVNATDAVNVSQLQGLAHHINNRIDDVSDDANAGVSSAMAMAALPQAYLPGKSMLTGGIASYNGEGAVAVGFSKLSDNGRWVLKVSGSADTQGNAGGAVGAGFHF